MNNSKRKNKKILVFLAILLTCALLFGIYWSLTGFSRQRKYYMSSVEEDIAAVRDKKSTGMSWFIPDELLEDTKYQEFLLEKVDEFFTNKENQVLYAFLSSIEQDTKNNRHEREQYAYLRDRVSYHFHQLETPEEALALLDDLRRLEYFISDLQLSRQSGAVASYISQHGINPYITTPGQGYYVGEEDTSSTVRHGIEGSNLHDSESVTYKGDFKIERGSGVQFNWKTYREESYSYETYVFRGEILPFNPEEGECVWSGEYMFCFDENGVLIDFTKLDVPTMDEDYNNAVAQMEEGRYEEAISVFKTMDGYKDTAEKINQCIEKIKEATYNQGVALMEEGKYLDAMEVLLTVSDYKDSGDKIFTCFETHRFAFLHEAKVGDRVYFGFYEQDNNPDSMEYIEWRVIDKQNNNLLVISQYVLDALPFHTSESAVTWENCSLRAWLNNDFLNSAFSDVEKAMIPRITVPAHNNPEYSIWSGNATNDQVFLLSATELEQYFVSNADRKAPVSDYARARGLTYSSGEASCFWWLRTPGMQQNYAALASAVGSISNMGSPVHIDEWGVRPAMWICLDSES